MRVDATVLGGGRMAAAYASILRSQNFCVSESPAELGEIIILSFFSGKQTTEFLYKTFIAPNTVIVDLTTQSISDAQVCLRIVTEASGKYFAGGVTGGLREVGTETFAVLLGGIPSGTEAPAFLSSLGRIFTFETVEQAVSAKLLHNLVLITINQVLGIALKLADKAGVYDIVSVLEAGTAGRSLRAASAVRDYPRDAISSYSSYLVEKDINAMIDSFPELEAICGFDLRSIAGRYGTSGTAAYTTCSLIGS